MKPITSLLAIIYIAARAVYIRAGGRFGIKLVPLGFALALSACSTLVDKPSRPTVYDFGPGPVIASTTSATLAPLVLGDIQANAALDTPAVLYRLGYANTQELRPYAQARWSTSPVQLVQQRLREVLGQRRSVVGMNDDVALARSQRPLPEPLLLRIELEEFSHVFSSPTQSTGLLRLRATVLEHSALGDKLLAQRALVLQRPAPTADAVGGTQALAAAVDAAALEIDQWLAQIR